MAYVIKEPVWQFVDQWQTLLTGGLALLAAVATIWATKRAADREISAAQEQTQVARDQMATSQTMERRRVAREGYAFAAALQVAMALIIEEGDEAIKLAAGITDGGTSPVAYQVRQRIQKTGFADLRGAFLRLGGELTEPFLRLENEIDDLARRWHLMPGTFSAETIRYGEHTGLRDQLSRIKAQAISLRDEATKDKQRCNEILMQERM